VTPDYTLLERQLRSLLAGERDFIPNAANFAAFIFNEIPDVNWAGFYLLTPSRELVLGPFCGKPACARLPAGAGVCGAAVTRREAIVVDDVSTFSDHIVCDTASVSEMVLPLFIGGNLRGVFDCDSPTFARFSEVDRAGIERLVAIFSESVHSPATNAR